MSIATEIQRLQTIKANIRNALVEQGIDDAETHNFADFANDILAIETKPKLRLPVFEYTGNSSLIDEGDGNWKLKLLSSGDLTFSDLGTGDGSIDVFCVGGGSGYLRGGAWDSYGYYYAKSCGGGGYTTTSTTTITKNSAIPVTVGAAASGGNEGGASTFNNSITAKGGASHGASRGGNGGSGGAGWDTYVGGSYAGGTNGANGGGKSANSSTGGGSGQGTTTREFGESTGDLYAAGGGNNIKSAVANSGNGASDSIGAQAGIVIIRNHRSA